jgi:Protein of unknown function (DUF1822)
MSTFDQSTHQPMHQPLPGEIWVVDVDLAHMINQHQSADYLCLARHVAIVREPQSAEPSVCSVILLSPETQYLSDVDLLIPPVCSGLAGDLLAETWNVGHLEINLLDRRVGKRLSRSIYDLLLSIGDVYNGLSIEIPSVELIRTLGLDVLAKGTASASFHQRERNWLQGLNPIAITRTQQLVQIATEIERESLYLERIRTTLSQWFQQIIEPQWRATQQFEQGMAIPTRNLVANAEVIEMISQLKLSNEVDQRCQLIKKLGLIAKNNQAALTALIDLMQTTQDDETLWIAVTSLRQLDPADPRFGISKVQSIDLGITVDFVVNIIPKAIDQFGILLQVYPSQSTLCLPANLKLILQDELGNSLKAVVAQAEDYCIQIKLSGVTREIFSVCLDLDGLQSIVDFVI